MDYRFEWGLYRVLLLMIFGLIYLLCKTGNGSTARLLYIPVPILVILALGVRNRSKYPNCKVTFAFGDPEDQPDRRGFLRRQHTVFYQCRNCAYRKIDRRYRK